MSATAVALFVASSAALAEIGQGPRSELSEARFVHHQPSPPGYADVTRPTGLDQDSPPHADFAHVLPVAALGRPSAGNPQSPLAAGPQAQATRPLPPGPDGASLFLLGAGCLGVVKIGRSARGMHLQALPEWYHTGGPAQIGHSVVFDFEFSPPAVRTLDEPPGEKQHFSHPQCDGRSRCEAQSLVTTESPRGPPDLS